MFLSTASIAKQLFYEFLNFNTLDLPPGKPCQLKPGTLLGSTSHADMGIAIESTRNQLQKLVKPHYTEDELKQFTSQLNALFDYKKAQTKMNNTDNPFSSYENKEETTAHPCAWLVFAPLFLNPMEKNLAFKTQEDFLSYLKQPTIAFSFSNTNSIENTGLYIAVQTKNHEMVDAFLCPQFYDYHLTKDDLKKLLCLTDDPETRITLLRHNADLIQWISNDLELKNSCIQSLDELSGLWSHLSKQQQKDFIEKTDSKLWLNLLKHDLSALQIEKLLGDDFSHLQTKLFQDLTIVNSHLIDKTLKYLKKEQQQSYLLERVDLNQCYPQPRGEEWTNLLLSLGYHSSSKNRLTTLRYLLPNEIKNVHDNLIQTLISLPIDAKEIIQALKKIECYVADPQTKEDYQNYLNRVAADATQKEYETSFFIINWFNKLLRFLKIKSESPLHPYINQLTQVVKDEPAIISGDIISILPATGDYKIYRHALSAYSKNQISDFWLHLPIEQRNEIIREPLRFAELIRLISTPVDYTNELFKAFDENTLKYFNTAEGLRQLILKTPSFTTQTNLSHLIEAMRASKIDFLGTPALALELLTDDSNVLFQQLCSSFPHKGRDFADMDFQENLLQALPESYLHRFLQTYCTNPHHFSALLLQINKQNPSLVENCWNKIPEEQWKQWFGNLEHAEEWSQNLNHLEINDRIEFFEKLTSGGELTAKEFCDFLLEKGEAVYSLWDKVPLSQWSTWRTKNELPSDPLPLLNAMPTPLRMHFFKSILELERPEDSLSVFETGLFYPNDVKNKLAEVTTIDEANAKLGSLKKSKYNEFNINITTLLRVTNTLNECLKEIASIDFTYSNTLSSYYASFFTSSPYSKPMRLISENTKEMDRLHREIKEHPLYAMTKNTPDTLPQLQELEGAIQALKNQFSNLEKEDLNIPEDLKEKLEKLRSAIEAIDSNGSGLEEQYQTTPNAMGYSA